MSETATKTDPGGDTRPDSPDDRAREDKAQKFTKAKKRKWIAAYRTYGTVSAASQAVGIHRATAYEHREKDEWFRDEWEASTEATTAILEATAYQRALDGSDRLAEFMLKARRPSVYRERVEHSGAVTVAVEEKVDAAITELVEKQSAEISRLTARLAELEPSGQDQAAGSATG